MIYFTDLYYRWIYLINALFFCIIYLYLYIDQFIFIFIIPSIFKTNLIDSFIFTEPKEIFFFKICICIFFLIITIIPYIIINVFDYFKAALYFKEWKILVKIQYFSIIFYYVFTILSFFFILPIFWGFFISLSSNSQLVLYFFELSALNYFNFLISTYLLIFFSLIFIYFFFLSIYYLGVKSILQIKFYIILIFLIFSTIVTPPDLEFQILLFLGLYICLEFFFFNIILLYFYLIFFKKVAN